MDVEKYKISRSRDEIGAEEIMVESEIGDDFGEVESSLGRFRIVGIGVLMILVILVYGCRTFQLQVIKGGIYSQEALDNRVRRVPVEAARGIIFSRDNRQLVSNAPVFDLAVITKTFPKNLEEREKLVENFQALSFQEFVCVDSKIIANISDAIIKFDLEKASLIIYRDIPREAALIIEANPEKFAGLEILRGIARLYLEKDLMAHILGYVGSVSREDLKANPDYLPTQYIGKSGIEMVYENFLKGNLGTQLVEVDSTGVKKKNLAVKDAEPGQDLILSIDYGLQKKIFNVLKYKTFEAGSTKSCAIAMDPRTGEILALVNFPSFDNNIFSGNIDQDDYKKLIYNKDKPLFNRAISGEYPPGSTIKPVVALAALEENIISNKTIIEDNGLIRIVNVYDPSIVYNFYGWNRTGLGPMNVYSAIAKSSDIFFYTIGGGNGDFAGLGLDELNNYFFKFKLGAKLGIDLPGESAGLVPTLQWKRKIKDEGWFLGDTYHVSIGQGDLLATPLQVVSWTGAIANGGTVVKPHVGLFVVDKDGSKQPIYSKEKDFLNMSEKNLQIIKDAMRRSVIDGSAKSLLNLPVEVAGKTGTAEFGIDDLTHAWFTCFAPFDDPEIALTILVEGGGGGSDVAVPIAKEVLEYWVGIR